MYIFLEKKAKLFANSGDLDQMPHSDLGLHCLPITLSWYSEYNGQIKMKLGKTDTVFTLNIQLP